MVAHDPTRCANCESALPADYVVIDQGLMSWLVCSWDCVRKFSSNPDGRKASETALGPLHKAWVRGRDHWYVYRAKGGAVVRRVTEHLVPFKSLAGAVSAAKSEAGPGATEITARSR